tara:strand:+ start:3235 stop:3504 length:270 start_codon:yes stop_codon:yes gene_type:complete
MRELGMSLSEIKSTSRRELEGLLTALSLNNRIHQFDGYTEKDVGEMSKDKPHVREEYHKSKELKKKYEILIGRTKKEQKVTLSGLLGQL